MGRYSQWFEVLPERLPTSGTLHYAIADHAFDFMMALPTDASAVAQHGGSSLLIGTIQIEVSPAAAICLYAWGYSPMGAWLHTTLELPNSSRASLRVHSEEPLISGVSDDLPNVDRTCWFDVNKGWLCVGSRIMPDSATAVEFADGCIAVLVDNCLKSLLLRPSNWREVSALIGDA